MKHKAFLRNYCEIKLLCFVENYMHAVLMHIAIHVGGGAGGGEREREREFYILLAPEILTNKHALLIFLFAHVAMYLEQGNNWGFLCPWKCQNRDEGSGDAENITRHDQLSFSLVTRVWQTFSFFLDNTLLSPGLQV